jgi:hypothetical protein
MEGHTFEWLLMIELGDWKRQTLYESGSATSVYTQYRGVQAFDDIGGGQDKAETRYDVGGYDEMR